MENLLVQEPLFPQKIIKPRPPNEQEPLYVQPKILDDPIGGVLDPDRVVKTEDNDYVNLNAVLKEYGAVHNVSPTCVRPLRCTRMFIYFSPLQHPLHD